MTPTQFRATLKVLGLTRLSAAKVFEVDEKTIRRWGKGEWPVPRKVQMLLKIAMANPDFDLTKW